MKVYKVIQMILPIVGSCFLPTLYAVDASELGLHSPIYIKGNDGFTMENGVISGNGTQENPYIIENLKIRANLRHLLPGWYPSDALKSGKEPILSK